LKISELNKNYFVKGSRGYTIITRYYSKYQDLFERTIFSDFNDFINQIFLNTSGINFNKEINNPEAYIIGTIKIQCRVQLDKALKIKKIIPESRLNKDDIDGEPVTYKLASSDNNPAEVFDNQEIFVHLNLFKLRLKEREKKLLNNLIDEKSRKEIADELGLNFNTLDTHIRRLRIKLADHFQNLGYSSELFDKFRKQ
jgi:RNA polymerase sigma factor (sigma-70 family)